jgi:hypothetical protein
MTPVGTAVSDAGAPRNAGVAPELRLKPSVLHFHMQQPKSKTEEVFGFEPGGSYHQTCSTLGIASITQERTQHRTAFFLISPLHRGRCVIGFVHSGEKGIKTKSLEVIVRG